MILYHTSMTEIPVPDIRRGRKNADFGQGFYLTPDEDFSYRWAWKDAVVNRYELDLTGLRVLRCGLHLGAMKGKIFQPDHAWCVSCAPPALPLIPLTEADARRFQAGEALPVAFDGKGWVLPALSGLPLGLGKVSGGLMKNHYPKGLRRAGSAPER